MHPTETYHAVDNFTSKITKHCLSTIDFIPAKKNKQTTKQKKTQQNTHTFRCINKIIMNMWSEPFSYLELLTMFMLTFICMITCCLFGWDGICAVFCFVCFYLYCRWSSKYQKGWDPINHISIWTFFLLS